MICPSAVRAAAAARSADSNETLRGLLLGTPVGSDPWTALAWCGGLLAAFDRRLRRAVPVAGRLTPTRESPW
jgi:hypothetical protein